MCQQPECSYFYWSQAAVKLQYRLLTFGKKIIEINYVTYVIYFCICGPKLDLYEETFAINLHIGGTMRSIEGTDPNGF